MHNSGERAFITALGLSRGPHRASLAQCGFECRQRFQKGKEKKRRSICRYKVFKGRPVPEHSPTLHPFISCEEVVGVGEEKWTSQLWLEAFPPGSLRLLSDCFLNYNIITQNLTSIKGKRQRKSKFSFHAHKFGLDLFFVVVCAYGHWLINAH